MEPVIPAPHALGRGVSDVLPAVCPPHLIALALHQRDELVFGGSVPHALVDGVHQPELPALALGGGAVLAGAHPLLLDLLLRRRKNRQVVGGADFIIGQPVGLQVRSTLVELAAVPEADAVHDQVAVQNVGVDVGCHQHLEVRELPLSQLQSDGVGFLGRQVIRCRKGLDEVVILPSVRFPEPLLCELHFREGGLGGAVPASHQLLFFPQCLFLLLRVPQHSGKSTPASATIFDRGEGGHLSSPPARAAGAAR